MKLKHLAVAFLFLACTLAANAWPCPTGQIRQQAPAGTPTTTPFYDVVEGIAFICVPIPQPPTDPKATNTNTNTNSNTNNNSATSGSTSNSTSGASATGGKSSSSSTATGGNATGGNANQKQGQSQSSSNNSSASNEGNNSTYESSETYNQVRQAPAAYAPTIIPSNCQGSITGGISSGLGGISLGGTKADKNCQRLALAAAFAAMLNYSAAAKVLCALDGSKAAHLTLAECQMWFFPPTPVIIPPVVPPTPAPVVIPPAPQPVIYLIEPPITVTATKEEVRQASNKPRPVVKKKPVANCPVIPDSLKHDSPLK